MVDDRGVRKNLLGWTRERTLATFPDYDPDRCIKSGRTWIPRYRFTPLSRLDDAFMVLDSIGGTYSLLTAMRTGFSP
jgi:hypothetical protein